jgi:hypothetical protein
VTSVDDVKKLAEEKKSERTPDETEINNILE